MNLFLLALVALLAFAAAILHGLVRLLGSQGWNE